MRKTIPILSLIAALSGLTSAVNAQVVVWHDDFDQQPIGVTSATNGYGAVAWNFSGAGYGDPVVCVTNDAPDTALQPHGDTNNCAMTFIPDFGTTADNFGLEINWIAASGNTQTPPRAYTLEFDMAIQGETMSSDTGYFGPGIGLLGNNSGIYCGTFGCTGYQLAPSPSASWFPAADAGYQHYSIGFTNFIAATGDNLMSPTESPITLYISFYIAGSSYTATEEIDLANVQIVMATNLVALAPPTVTVTPAPAGLRVFAQDSTEPYNQEGFSTEDTSQSWVDVATATEPVTYAVTFEDFNTVNGYTCFVQFAQNANPGDPFGVYNAANALVWSISSSGPGGTFSTAVNWKTNMPANGEPNNALSLTTTTTTGVGTWMLTFSNDFDGYVTAPDGTTGSFSLDPTVTPSFANPLVIDFGTCPNWNTAGFGQFIDYKRIAITNVLDGNEYDDFTQDTSLNTALWNPGFSYNAGSVIQVPAGSYWVNWTVPDEGFASGLETKARLTGGTNVWFSPNYYGNGAVTNSTPTLMGTGPKWTLVPAGCLPTVDGTQGGAPSPSGFFRLSNPGPSQ